MDLPHSSVFQCTNGHLMCSACFTHLLADARLRDETATCPSCRCIITRDVCSRNLAVEKAVSELPGSCRFCERELPRAMLQIHENEGCDERLVHCRFSRIGCPWRVPFHELGKLLKKFYSLFFSLFQLYSPTFVTCQKSTHQGHN